MDDLRSARRYRLARIAAAPIAALAMLLTGPVMGLPAASAARPASPSFFGAASLTGVACPETSWCMAVGSYTSRAYVQHSLAQIWDGKSWKVLKPPGASLTGISCLAISFCLVTGGPSGALTWNGKTWREIAGPQYPATAPSCVSRSLCMLINGTSNGQTHDVVESWNGRVWHTWWQETNACALGYSPCGLNDVSCGSAVNCVAVGFASGRPQAFAWNGRRWSSAPPPGLAGSDGPGEMTGVFCTGSARGSCLGMGAECCKNYYESNAIVATWSARTQSWTLVSNGGFYCANAGQPVCAAEYAMSCASATNCMVGTSALNDQHWNGLSWQPDPSVGEGDWSLLGALSCHGVICMAVGYQTHQHATRALTELWNGTDWTVIPTPV